MDVDTQPWLDSFSHTDDIHLLVRDVNDIISELLRIMDQSKNIRNGTPQPYPNRLQMLLQTIMPILDHIATASLEIDHLHQQLYQKIQECDKQMIEIAALQTRLSAKDKQCKMLESENETMKDRLHSILGSLDTTLGS